MLLDWKITFGYLLLEVGPCRWLHSVLRCEMISFGTNTLPRVPMTGSQEGDGMESIMMPENCESETVMPSLPQASLSLCSFVMCPGKVSVFPSVMFGM